MKNILLAALFLVPVCVNGQIITRIAGRGSAGYYGDGVPALSAELSPSFMAYDPAGNLYVSEENNNTVRKIDTAGIITTVAGTGVSGLSGDGGPATLAKMFGPAGVVMDPSGNLVIADGINYRIRRVDPAGIITHYAGAGSGGYTGDYGPASAAGLFEPTGMTYNSAGNLVFADEGNGVVRTINTATGIINTIAGSHTHGYSGDGGLAISATMSYVSDVTYDALGNLYIADANDHVIRMVNTAGIISTVAGTGFGHGTATGGYTGDGGPAISAELNYPTGVRVDGLGNIFIADRMNNVIRKVNTAGIISTFAGTGVRGGGGDGGPATAAIFTEPMSVLLDKDGNLLIADYFNGDVRKVAVLLSIASAAGDTICSGNLVTFNATVSSAGYNIGYQWKVNGVNTGTGSSSYSTSSLATGDMVTCNLYNSVTGDTITTSDTANMYVYPTPDAGTISGSGPLCQDATLSLADTATGGVWSSSGAHSTISSAGVVTGTSGGSDVITYTVATAHCSATATQAITVTPLPVAGTITGSTDTVCQGQTLSLTDGSAGGSWSMYDATMATVGSTGVVKGLLAVEGIDTVYYTVSNSCGTAQAALPVMVIDCNAGVKNVGSIANEGMSIYPNPSTGAFTVTVASARNENVHLVLTNMLGETVQEWTIATNNTVEIKANMPAGIYYLSAGTASGRYNASVSVMR